VGQQVAPWHGRHGRRPDLADALTSTFRWIGSGGSVALSVGKIEADLSSEVIDPT
jgi:hypothetical protein